jgi:putative NIF3 family GTP cyclohydrolase 1 type 2
MTTVRDLYKLMDEKAPFSMQESWDSSGLLVGRWDAPVERVLLSLDITPGVIAEAKERGCGLILSHHPVIFGGTKAVTDADYTGERVLALAEAGIAALCCHTCLDAAPDGVNDELARRCGLKFYGVDVRHSLYDIAASLKEEAP